MKTTLTNLITWATVLLLFIFTCISIVGCKKDDEEFVPLKITSVNPSFGSIGDTITLVGEGFSPEIANNLVNFSGSSNGANLVGGGDTRSLKVIVPSGATTGVITVKIFDEVATSPVFTVSAPEISSILPDSAWVGDTVKISGNNFPLDIARVDVLFKGNSQKATVLKVTKQALEVIVPDNVSNGKIALSGIAGPEFKVRASVINAVTPDKAGVGDTIVIAGKGFPADFSASYISFKTASAVITPEALVEKNARRIKVIVPANAVSGEIEVTVGQSKIKAPQLTVIPSIKSIAPLNGPIGQKVTLTGYNFGPTADKNVVEFNGVPAKINSATTTELIAVVPAGATTGPVSVKADGHEVTFATPFTLSADGDPIVESVAPDNGPVGSEVSISGLNFSPVKSENTIKFSKTAVTEIVSASHTELVVKVPAGATTGAVSVTVKGKTATGAAFTITETPTPVISKISPAQGSLGGTITITGVNFSSDKNIVSVLLTDNAGGTTSFEVLESSTTSIKAKIPNKDVVVGELAITVAINGKNSAQKVYTIGATPTISSLSITEGSTGDKIKITGNYFNTSVEKNEVFFGDVKAEVLTSEIHSSTFLYVKIPAGLTVGTLNVTLKAFGFTSNAVAFKVKEAAVAVKNVFFTSWIQVGTGNKVRIQKSVYGGATTTIYETIGQLNLSTFVIDLEKSKIYFVNTNDISINKCNLDGTGVESLFDANDLGGVAPYDLTLDATNGVLFWTSNSVDGIYKGKADGSGTPQKIYTATAYFWYGVTYIPENNKLYWISTDDGVSSQLLSASADGTGTPVELFNAADNLGSVYDYKIDYSNGKMFIIDSDPATGDFRVLQGNLDGTGTLASRFSGSSDHLASGTSIALDLVDQYIYWTEAAGDQSAIYRGRYDGQNIPGVTPSTKVQKIYSIGNTAGTSGSGALAVEQKASASQRKRPAPIKFGAIRKK